MLKELIIKNIALIESSEVIFTDGLNVLSGETGAGKSVILDTINFVLGAKADKSMIRHGESFCSAKAVFDISNNNSVREEIVSQGFEDDTVLTIFRKFSLSGSSEVKVNGESLSVSALKKITSKLVDVHGQSEHFYLLKENNQLELIDKFSDESVTSIKNAIFEKVKKLKTVNESLENLGGDERQRAIKLDVLQYQVDEIKKVDFVENEDDELLVLKEKLQNQTKITDALNTVRQALSSEYGATDTVSTAKYGMNAISNISQEYQDIFNRLENAYAEISDISDTVSDMLENFDYSEYTLESVNERLSQIRKLKNKYGASYEEIQQFLTNAEEEIEKLNNFDELAKEYKQEKERLVDEIYSLYIKLHDVRVKKADEFADKVLTEIKELNMKNANFKVEFAPLEDKQNCSCLYTNGIDSVNFLFSANLGEPLKPLSKIISGGEISRFMLAIKAQTAKYNDVSTFIFDEIDAGISGETASVVAKKFIKLSKDVQIIAISHLPQIASVADNNLLIKKYEDDQKTYTEISALDYDGKVKEILRLIGGASDDDTALEHAKHLITTAEELKNNI